MVKKFTKKNDTINTSANPTLYHLFKIEDNAMIIEDTKSNIYHNPPPPRNYFPSINQCQKSISKYHF